VLEVLERRPSAGWFEVHAENYMSDGIAAERLEKIRSFYELSIHGVGLSLGSGEGIDEAHLLRLKAVVDRFQPALVSEHLAWTVAGGVYLNDLLPVPHDEEALDIVSANISRTQDVLGRQILIENLSTYVDYAQSVMSETEFLTALVRRTGCGLLLDINNVHVSACNTGFEARSYIDALPISSIGEFHLAGHSQNQTADGPILIDSHDSPIAPEVWSLYAHAVQRIGRRPTLIEWDSEIPSFSVLQGEAMWADLLAGALSFAPVPSARPIAPAGRTCEQITAIPMTGRGAAPVLPLQARPASLPLEVRHG
jgi:hypothetical protein